ncbi:hypothetical protein MKY29_12040 [Psychrobacillus sp. FSL K6-2365]|uniref:hypothetical protein n=1 Tax=Psychrobacillus sp. FSL K6-2365 TaxID=2921546 RepID=UPI0030F6E586
MTDNELERANKLKLEIKELESFLFSAERVWTGKIVKQTSKFLIKSNPYGVFNEAEYNMNTEMKNKVLDVLKERLTDLKNQLKSI